MSKSFPFTQKGLEDCLAHKDYIGMTKEAIENHPEVLPVALLLCLGVSALILNPLASAVAYKSGMIGETAEIAFKYIGGM